MSPARSLGEDMMKLEDLADESLARRILDYEAYRSKIPKVFQRVKEATTSFHVHTLMFIEAYALADLSFPDRNGEQHPGNGKHDT